MPLVTRRILYGRLHSMLRLLLSLIPTLSSSLAPLLSLHFPSKREPQVAQICYIDNLLAISEYCPALAEDILTLIIERALNIDVEIQGEPGLVDDFVEFPASREGCLDVEAMLRPWRSGQARRDGRFLDGLADRGDLCGAIIAREAAGQSLVALVDPAARKDPCASGEGHAGGPFDHQQLGRSGAALADELRIDVPLARDSIDRLGKGLGVA